MHLKVRKRGTGPGPRADGAPGLEPAAGLGEPPPLGARPPGAVTCTPDAAEQPQNPAPRCSLRTRGPNRWAPLPPRLPASDGPSGTHQTRD